LQLTSGLKEVFSSERSKIEASHNFATSKKKFGWKKSGRRPLEWGPDFWNLLSPVSRTDPCEQFIRDDSMNLFAKKRSAERSGGREVVFRGVSIRRTC
jgi:hypothetical protein